MFIDPSEIITLYHEFEKERAVLLNHVDLFLEYSDAFNETGYDLLWQ